MTDAEPPVESAEGPVAAPPRPDDEAAAACIDRFPEVVYRESHGQSVLYVDRSRWHDLVEFLRDVEQFNQCSDITAVDHLLDEEVLAVPGVARERFEVVANFLSLTRNRRIRVIAQLPTEDPRVASIVDLFPGTENAEREVWDLLGVVFDGHPELTRILMPDDWAGHPLRKDAPGARVPVTFKGDRTPQ